MAIIYLQWVAQQTCEIFPAFSIRTVGNTAWPMADPPSTWLPDPRRWPPHRRWPCAAAAPRAASPDAPRAAWRRWATAQPAPAERVGMGDGDEGWGMSKNFVFFCFERTRWRVVFVVRMGLVNDWECRLTLKKKDEYGKINSNHGVFPSI